MKQSKDRQHASAGGGEGLPERWRAEIVLGSRFGAGGLAPSVPGRSGSRAEAKTGDPMERELVRTRAKLGEVMMRLELSEELLEKRGVRGPS